MGRQFRPELRHVSCDPFQANTKDFGAYRGQKNDIRVLVPLERHFRLNGPGSVLSLDGKPCGSGKSVLAQARELAQSAGGSPDRSYPDRPQGSRLMSITI
jgi:hypothetical protein